MLIGYARVSTEDQDLTLQRSALKDIGCKRIYEEKVTGAKRTRPQNLKFAANASPECLKLGCPLGS